MGSRKPLAPPGAPSRRSRDGKKGKGGPAPLKKSKPPDRGALAVSQKHGYHVVMNRSEAINRLKGCAEAIKARGATSLYLFGSAVRDEARADSDLDLFIDYDP